MDALFIELPAFERHRKDYLSDELFHGFQQELMKNPEAGDVIEGTGGLRKVRFVDERRNKGKRGGLRVIYYWWSGVRSSGYSPYTAKTSRTTWHRTTKKRLNTCWTGKSKREHIMKREIFSELVEGFDALADERQGKITLRTHKVHLNKLAPLTAEEVVAVRQQLNLSRSVFAMYLRTNTRTLENWEQGRAKPNAQAVTLIRLVARFPETVAQLAALS